MIITMSCTTAAVSTPSMSEYENGFYPVKSVEIPFVADKYVMSSKTLSYISPSQTTEQNDFEVLVSFANKMLANEVGIDEEIQHVINNSFWDML